MFRRGFRRFGSSKRRFGSSSFRGRRLRVIRQTVKWEVGRISLDADRSLPAGVNSENVEYFHLASIATSIASTTAGSEQRVGAMLAGMQRRCEIGGVVLDYMHEHSGDTEGDGSIGSGSYDVHMSLLVDRIVKDPLTEVPFPGSIGTFSPFFTSFPTSIFGATGPIEATEPADAPTRILFEHNIFRDIRPKELANDIEGVLYVPQDQRLAVPQGRINRRLKLQLDEAQGLYFCVATRNSNNFAFGANQRRTRFKLLGKIYYRFRQ